jgi:hypothetical protein
MSSAVNISNCITAKGFSTYVPYTIVTLLQIILSGLSIPLVFYNAVIFYRRRGTIHKNFLVSSKSYRKLLVYDKPTTLESVLLSNWWPTQQGYGDEIVFFQKFSLWG